MIVAISMVKNEDVWLGRALYNIKDFADEIVVIDTGSTDGTLEIAKAAGAKILHVHDLQKTHDAITCYLEKKCWVFAVDGDEVYDPAGLRKVKEDIEQGAFANSFQIEENFFHVISFRGKSALGYKGPPAHAPSKLYNCANLVSWPADGKRTLLHAKTRVIFGGCIPRDSTYQTRGWDDSPLRCLHVRFLRRSSMEKEGIGKRANPEDLILDKKQNTRPVYKKGELSLIDAAPFLSLTTSKR